VRESRNGGGSYRGGWRRSFASHVPGSVLAAVPIYSNAGDTCLLVVDLDVKLGGREQVLTDAAAVAALVHRCGGELISDESPSGGIHLYIPLARPVAFDAAREVARALASRCNDHSSNADASHAAFPLCWSRQVPSANGARSVKGCYRRRPWRLLSCVM